ncbi:lamin tail domain-containing protein [bacterium]|nr:lamin tail domain-containing protein [bacterium]
MKFAKIWFCAILVSFLPVSQAVAFDFQLNKNYVEFSEVDSKKIIGLLARELREDWISSFTNNHSPQETTAISFLRDASVFDFWNYALADLPADTVISTLKIAINDFSSEEETAKKLIDRIEKLSVKEAVRIAKEELFSSHAKVSFGAIRGMNSKDNKETIFQYIIVYKPVINNKGLMTIRFYSPESINPPQTKASYGLSLGFVNTLEDGEKLPPFMVEIRGEVEDALSGSYKFTSLTETKVSFSENVPDLKLAPVSWKDKYVINPLKDFIKNIPIVGELFNADDMEVLKGSGGDAEKIEKEVMNVINGDVIEASELELPLRKNKEDSKKETERQQKEEEKEAKQKEKQQKEDEEKKKQEEKLKKAEEAKAKKELEKKIKDEEKKRKEEEKLKKDEEKRKQDEQKRILKEKEKEEKMAEVKQKAEDKEKQKQEKAEKELKYSKKCERHSIAQVKRNSIIFNEIAWMGSKENSSYEWIELKNIGNQPVDIDGWKIYGKSSSEDFVFKKSHIVNPGEYVLLEKNEKAISWINADFIFSGSINNSDEKYYLYDSECNLFDTVSADPDWAAGSNEEKRTMENAGDFSWHTYSGSGMNGIFGTPGFANSNFDNSVEERVRRVRFPDIYNPPKRKSSASLVVNENKVINYCSFDDISAVSHNPVIINEVGWMGTANSSSDEWIELKNITDTEVSLSGWQMLDKNEDIKIVFDENDKIEPNGFYLLERTNDDSVGMVLADKIYSGGLSDSSESLTLFNTNCELIDNINAVDGWVAGNAGSKRSMERSSDFSWHTYMDVISSEGLYATPRRENSVSNGEENEENDEDDENENEDEEEISEIVINDLVLTKGDIKNQIILEWSKTENNLEYEVFYSLQENASGLISVENFFTVEIGDNNEKKRALISDLYFGHNYYFSVKAKRGDDYSPISNIVFATIGDSAPLLSFKTKDYSNSLNSQSVGPSKYEDKTITGFTDEIVKYSTYAVVDANENLYIKGEVNGKMAVNCFYPDGRLKWQFIETSGNITIGHDGTVYFNSTEYVYALSPAGKLKWKEKFATIISKDIVIDNNGKIFILASDDKHKSELFSLEEQNGTIEKKMLISADELWGNTPSQLSSEIRMDDFGNLYFALSNILIKYNIENDSFERRVIESVCSQSIYNCHEYMPNVLSIITYGKTIYATFKDVYIGDYANLSGFFAIDVDNFLGNPVWETSNYLVLAVSGNIVYGYNTISTIFVTKSKIIGLDTMTGSEKFSKEWNNIVNKKIAFIDSDEIVYIKIGTKLIGYDFKNNTEDIVFEVDYGEKESIFSYNGKTIFSGNGLGRMGE